MPALKREWLREKHPIYLAWEDIWRQNERRLRGGTEVLVELRRFDWEKKSVDQDAAYKARQSDATYINFPDLHASVVAGHMLREAPGIDGGIDFGTLGKVRSEGATPDRARLVYYNVDGQAQEGSQWDQWWMAKLKLAMATGHRWLMCDSTPQRPMTALDEMKGLRPYAAEFSPLSVTNWDLENGVLNFAVLKVRRRHVEIDRQTGSFKSKGQYEDSWLLMVRKGYTKLDGVESEGTSGDKFSEGGWWKFDKELEFINAPGTNTPEHGDFETTGGEIPMFPFFFERDEGSVDMPAMSRPALTSLGQVAISYMNLSSAADYDAWDAGQSVSFILGISPGNHKEVVNQATDGSKIIGVPLTVDADGSVHMPTLVDGSQGAVTSEVWDKRLTNKWEEARILAALEATGDPNTSGISKQISFEQIMSPKLAHVAANIEGAQRQLIRLFEMRFRTGATPSGSVTWPRTFQLKNIIEDINAIFEMEALTGYKNPDFGAELIGKAIEELALETDPEKRAIIVAKYKEFGNKLLEAETAALDRVTEQPTPTPGGNPDDEPEPEE